MTYIEVTPAYGRDYRNQKDARADWDADKDFRETSTRRYINKTQAQQMGLSVIIRYDQNRKVMDVSKK
jgi:hypothetical protein